MKITGVEVLPVARRLLVVVHTDAGVLGLGESAMTREHRAIAGLAQDWAPRLIGADPARIEHVWQLLSRSGFFPAKRLLSSFQAAVDIALWDIQGKVLGVPVHQLLGGRYRDRVPAYTHIETSGRTDDTPGLLDRAHAAVEAGWRYLRWGLPTDGAVVDPTHSVRTAVQQLSVLRSELGDDVELIIDVHTRLRPADAVRLCVELEPFRPYFVEDPVRSENPASYASLRARTRVPLAAGEQWASRWEFREAIESELIDYARVDVCVAGGLSESRRIAAAAETHHIDVSVHNPLGPVSTAAAAHLNIALPNAAPQEQQGTPGTELTDIVQGQIELRDGDLLVSDRPGLGLTIDLEAARARTEGGALPPIFVGRDGGLANW
jgi:L-alanine-DL-glutamate epimerase-like enolase superfamily enzyme